MKKIIFLHGALGCSENFDTIRNEVQSNFDTYSFDFYGHGSLSSHDGAFSIENFTAQLRDFITENSLSEADIFAYSMGGYVALNYCLQYKVNKIKLMTFATKFDWNPITAQKEVKMLNPDKIIEKVPKFADDLIRMHGDNWKIMLQKSADLMLRTGENPLLTPDMLSSLTNKVRVCVGDKDLMVSIDESMLIQRSLQNSSLTVFPDTAHPLNKININRLKYEIIDFFSK
ncbi:MAG: alpha/beta hydrolase [Candidatus Kapaibacterium sp.]|jgi:pimeloyl-ACP methyl ester carboxylesterase|nr:alpha/beta hydrolase [Candidatus Kapabacteria bacterium]